MWDIYEGYDYDPETVPFGRRHAAENAREWFYIDCREIDKAYEKAQGEDRS